MIINVDEKEIGYFRVLQYRLNNPFGIELKSRTKKAVPKTVSIIETKGSYILSGQMLSNGLDFTETTNSELIKEVVISEFFRNQRNHFTFEHLVAIAQVYGKEILKEIQSCPESYGLSPFQVKDLNPVYVTIEPSSRTIFSHDGEFAPKQIRSSSVRFIPRIVPFINLEECLLREISNI